MKNNCLIVYLILPFFGLIVALFSLEAFFRITEVFLPRHHKYSDRPKDYFFPEDDLSSIDYSYSRHKNDNTFRIGVVGDSISFGPHLEMEDTFPKRLEHWLNLNKISKHVEVINYGHPGYSTFKEIPLAKQALEEETDLVLLQITLNDPELNLFDPKKPGGYTFGEFRYENGVFKYFHFLSFVFQRIHNNLTHKSYIKYFYDLFENPKTWSNFTKSIEEISKLTSSKNKKLVAVIFPLFGIPIDKNYPFRDLHKQIKTYLDSKNIATLDLLNQYKNIPLERLQVIPGKDFHPNEIAHRIAAEATYHWLKKLHSIPEEFFARRVYHERIAIKEKSVKSPTNKNQIKKS